MSLGDMDGKIWRYFPEDLFMNVMVFLPVPSLLRFRTVSKKWNAVPKDPRFHEMRDTFFHEFIWEVLGCQTLRKKSYVFSSTNGFLLVVKMFYEIYIMRPSMASLRQISRPEWSLQGKQMELQVVGMVVDEDTKEYTVMVSSRVSSTRSLPGGVVRQGNALWELDRRKDLHLFKSATGVWSWCGNGGRSLCAFSPLVGVSMHRGSVLVLVMCDDHYQIQSYNGSCSWETLRGSFPYSGLEIPLLFEHKGKLRLAVADSSGCHLWKYDDDSSEWMVMHLQPNTGFYDAGVDRQYVDSVAFSFCAAAGDFLYFGILSYEGETSLCRRMKYNLTTRVLERMCQDEHERMLVRDKNLGQSFIFKAA